MPSITEIREDLKDIRYYYAHKDVFDRACRNNVSSAVIQKAERYNRIIEKAPPILFDLYVSLYMQNNTQAAFAYDRDYSINYIKDLNNKLCLFLQRTMNKQGGSNK